MAVDIRSSPLRQARESVDTGRGVLRTAGNPMREKYIGKGSFLNWQEDLGISATEQGAQQARKEETDFQAKISEKRERVQGARGQLQGAWDQLGTNEAELNKAANSWRPPDASGAVDSSWNQFRSTLVPIEVAYVSYGTTTSGEGAEVADTSKQNLISSTYYFPQNLAHELLNTKGIRGDQLDNGGMRIKTDSKGYQKLSSELSEQSKILESSYRAKATQSIADQLAGVKGPDFSGAYSELGAAKGTLQGYQSQLDAAQADLDNTVAVRQKQWDEIHNNYQNKIETMSEIFSGLNIKKGKTKNES